LAKPCLANQTAEFFSRIEFVDVAWKFAPHLLPVGLERKQECSILLQQPLYTLQGSCRVWPEIDCVHGIYLVEMVIRIGQGLAISAQKPDPSLLKKLVVVTRGHPDHSLRDIHSCNEPLAHRLSHLGDRAAVAKPDFKSMVGWLQIQ